jgi:hypothetical protein
MLGKENWQETRERFIAWWRREKMDRPLMRIVAKRKEPLGELEPVAEYDTPGDMYLNAGNAVKRMRNYCKTHKFLAEAYPNLSMDLGPGSLALYLGSEPGFAWDTVWFSECVHEWKGFGPLRFDHENRWWKKHQEMLREVHDLAKGDFLINIPDIVENVDILSAMRGPQAFCYDLVDEPELMKEYVEKIDELYFQYYDALYNIVKVSDGSSSYTCFQIWGPGRTAKIQCDFCALMSPGQFREFVQPSLRKQCQRLDNSLYHLDGPDAIKHLDALMEIEELDALQWTAGAGQPDGGSEKWYPVYDKVKAAGKGLWTSVYDGEFKDWVDSADRLVKRYGSQGLYLLFPEMEEEQAAELMRKVEREWR